MNATAAEFLASLYRPPLKRFPAPTQNPHHYARAAAWGQALSDWLAGYQNEKTRCRCRQSLAMLFSFSCKLPWEVRPADVARWLELWLDELAPRTRISRLQHVRVFYRFACAVTWISPSGRRLRLCRSDPTAGIAQPALVQPLRSVPLSESELNRLMAAIDLDTLFGRRDFAIFTVILETGLQLRQVLALRLNDLAPGLPESVASDAAGPSGQVLPFGRPAAWQAVQAYLQAAGRLAGMQPEDYLFTPLADLTGSLAKMHPQDWQRQPLHHWVVHESLRAYAAWAGLAPGRVTPQTLRYTGARRLLESGAGLPEVARFLGIKSLYTVAYILRRLPAEGAVPPAEHPSSARSTSAGCSSAGPSPGPIRRRRTGGQPGNRCHFIYGASASRFRLKRFGIHRTNFSRLADEDIPHVIAALKAIQLEILSFPQTAPEMEIKKLDKLRYIVYVTGRLKAHYERKRRRAREEDG